MTFMLRSTSTGQRFLVTLILGGWVIIGMDGQAVDSLPNDLVVTR